VKKALNLPRNPPPRRLLGGCGGSGGVLGCKDSRAPRGAQRRPVGGGDGSLITTGGTTTAEKRSPDISATFPKTRFYPTPHDNTAQYQRVRDFLQQTAAANPHGKNDSRLWQINDALQPSKPELANLKQIQSPKKASTSQAIQIIAIPPLICKVWPVM
jgi:hypothetical protein